MKSSWRFRWITVLSTAILMPIAFIGLMATVVFFNDEYVPTVVVYMMIVIMLIIPVAIINGFVLMPMFLKAVKQLSRNTGSRLQKTNSANILLHLSVFLVLVMLCSAFLVLSGNYDVSSNGVMMLTLSLLVGVPVLLSSCLGVFKELKHERLGKIENGHEHER